MIELQGLSKTFHTANGTVEALQDISITINDGEIFGIIGLSGAGKSTLVRCINLLERPTSGKVIIDGKNLTDMPQRELLNMRRSISMIFQGFNLLEQRNVLKNVCFPLEISGWKSQDAKARAEELLKIVGLSDRKNAYPSQLSGGQKQRVAIARALATKPKYLLCDEATSALDPNTTRSILELLRTINDTMGVTIVVITHEMKVIDQICDRMPDIVISGINHGDNASVNSHYSGTMGVAREGCMKGIPSVAFSLCNYSPDADFSNTARLIKIITGRVLEDGLPKNVCLNVNFPDTPEIKGTKVCRMCNGIWEKELVKERHPRGYDYYWMVGQFRDTEPEATDTDEWALAHGYAAITPTTIDTTAYSAMQKISDWDL